MKSELMNIIALIFIMVISFFGCHSEIVDETVELIWDGSGKPHDITTPNGFEISPEYAYSKVWDKKILSPKHIWHIYADKESYYIIDSFLGSSPLRALREGIIIDGKTGMIKNR
ncbi:MAG: hypothetical protein HKM93_20280 [Desulfobacteraceae bacterium]|nr:hypothetical protein [Desulfobacteraceae bacterium]